MKKLASAFTMFCLMAMLVCMSSTMAHAGDYLGDFCWSFTSQPYGTTATIRLGITSIGGGHFLCSGIFTVDNYPENWWPPEGKFTTYGNAELVGNKIVITLSYAGARDGVTGNDMSIITLDPQTLNGTGKGIGVYSDKIEQSETTVKFIGVCQ